MAPEVVVFPNGHDSTGMPEARLISPSARIQTIGLNESVGSAAINFEDSGSRTTFDRQPTRRIPTEELYSEFENVSPELRSAIQLLSLSLQHLDQALSSLRENDSIGADDAVQRVQSVLPELFCCRNLGDAYGMVVNALVCGFQNLAGVPLNRSQMERIRQTLVKLRTEPFLREGDALKVISALEDAGLVVEPAEFEVLQELLDE